jgi:cobalt/nickel transport system permease protein
MHMADALVSPVVGGVSWGILAGGVAWTARRLARAHDDRRAALMGVLGAFVFAAQMVNFVIPGTGSSGHLGGGLLLAILLGPDAAFLVMTSVLIVQALLFADGGILALGCNVINLGFATSWVAYPLVFHPLAGRRPSGARLWGASVAAGILGLELGALGVVLETTASRQVGLPFEAFLAAMLPLHLAIGLVEGLVTAAVVQALWRARPDLADGSLLHPAGPSLLRAALGVALCAAVIAGLVSRYASTSPDGLEGSLAQVLGKPEVAPPDTRVHAVLARAQSATAVFPEYGESSGEAKATVSKAGIAGAGATLLLAFGAGLGLRALRRRTAPGEPARSCTEDP